MQTRQKNRTNSEEYAVNGVPAFKQRPKVCKRGILAFDYQTWLSLTNHLIEEKGERSQRTSVPPPTNDQN
jgi:hypothetical protein